MISPEGPCRVVRFMIEPRHEYVLAD
jgi:hypothetical protein